MSRMRWMTWTADSEAEMHAIDRDSYRWRLVGRVLVLGVVSVVDVDGEVVVRESAKRRNGRVRRMTEPQ